MKHFDALVVSGGGVKGAAAAGAVREFQRAGALDHLRLAVGTSAGAVVAAAVATGLDLDAVFHASTRSFTPTFDIAQLGTSYGVDSGASLETWIAGLGFGDETLGGVAKKRGVKLVVCVTNVETRSAEYLSAETAPDLRIADALRMSCSVPLLFAAKRYEGRLLIDGCLTDNFPAHWAIHHGGAKKPLGITMSSAEIEVPTNLASYIMAVFECATGIPALPPGLTHLDIRVPCRALQLDLPRKDLRKLYRIGVAQAAELIKKMM